MTDQHPKPPRDPNQLAKSIIDSVTGQQPSPVDNWDPAAAELGRKGGAATTASLTPEARPAVGWPRKALKAKGK